MSHISNFIPKDSRPSKDRVLTEKQQKFLDCLIDTGGDPKSAAVLAGYAEGTHSQVIKSLQKEVIDLASNILAQSAPQAAFKLVEVMTSDEAIPQVNTKLNAAQTILDRVGIAKTDRLDVNHNVDVNAGSLFILPAKEVNTYEGELD
jgi:phage terminase small subunit|tara:strand:- start:1576 stop:2016 length:441 start_codon:yes stop_codon:yes gene_type:complete